MCWKSGTVPLSPPSHLRSFPTHGVCSVRHKDVLLVHFYQMYIGSVGRCVDASLVLVVGGYVPFVLLVLVVRDQQVQLLLRGELSIGL